MIYSIKPHTYRQSIHWCNQIDHTHVKYEANIESSRIKQKNEQKRVEIPSKIVRQFKRSREFGPLEFRSPSKWNSIRLKTVKKRTRYQRIKYYRNFKYRIARNYFLNARERFPATCTSNC